MLMLYQLTKKYNNVDRGAVASFLVRTDSLKVSRSLPASGRCITHTSVQWNCRGLNRLKGKSHHSLGHRESDCRYSLYLGHGAHLHSFLRLTFPNYFESGTHSLLGEHGEQREFSAESDFDPGTLCTNGERSTTRLRCLSYRVRFL